MCVLLHVCVSSLLTHVCIHCLHPHIHVQLFMNISIDFLLRSLTVRVAISGLQWCKVGVAVSSITPDTPTWEHFVSQVDLSTWSGLCVVIIPLLTGYARV